MGIFHYVHVRRPAACARTRLDDAGCRASRAPSTEPAEEEKNARRLPVLSERTPWSGALSRCERLRSGRNKRELALPTQR